jgi:hypothetical protein
VNTPCFSADQFGVSGFGNVSRNAFRGAMYFDIDYGATKSFVVKERYHFAIGANMYNLLNHANFAIPNVNADRSGLGVIQSAYGPPTSAYGAAAGSAVTGRVVVSTIRFTF